MLLCLRLARLRVDAIAQDELGEARAEEPVEHTQHAWELRAGHILGAAREGGDPVAVGDEREEAEAEPALQGERTQEGDWVGDSEESRESAA